MTLIAAYRHEGIPALIGDMAVSKPGFRTLRKKIYKISHNFAVGWTGHQIVAKEIIGTLMSTFKGQEVSRDAIERHFTKYEAEEFGELHTKFIGWIIDDKPRCFLWNCLYPKQLFFDQSYFDGSGQKYYEQLKKRKWENGGSEVANDEKVVLSIINDVAIARFEESLCRKTWDISYGAAYDILMFLDGSFRYVRSILHIGWDYHWNSLKGTGNLEQAPIVMKYNCMGDFSIFQEALHGKHYDGKTINYLSRPVYDEMLGADLSNMHMSLQSDYYANYFLFRDNGKTIFKTVLTIQKIDNEGPLNIEYQANSPNISFDNCVLDEIYQRHRA